MNIRQDIKDTLSLVDNYNDWLSSNYFYINEMTNDGFKWHLKPVSGRNIEIKMIAPGRHENGFFTFKMCNGFFDCVNKGMKWRLLNCYEFDATDHNLTEILKHDKIYFKADGLESIVFEMQYNFSFLELFSSNQFATEILHSLSNELEAVYSYLDYGKDEFIVYYIGNINAIAFSGNALKSAHTTVNSGMIKFKLSKSLTKFNFNDN